jgi:hypothetical protein
MERVVLVRRPLLKRIKEVFGSKNDGRFIATSTVASAAAFAQAKDWQKFLESDRNKWLTPLDSTFRGC